MDDQIRRSLEHAQTIDITTTGRRTGRAAPARDRLPRLRRPDLHLGIAGADRTRAWLLNLEADPHLTFHLKGDVMADLPGDRADHHRRRRAASGPRLHRHGLEEPGRRDDEPLQPAHRGHARRPRGVRPGRPARSRLGRLPDPDTERPADPSPKRPPTTTKPRRSKRFVLPDDQHDERMAERIEAFVHGPTRKPTGHTAAADPRPPTARERHRTQPGPAATPRPLDTRQDWNVALQRESAGTLATAARPRSCSSTWRSTQRDHDLERSRPLGGRGHAEQARETDRAVRIGATQLRGPDARDRRARGPSGGRPARPDIPGRDTDGRADAPCRDRVGADGPDRSRMRSARPRPGSRSATAQLTRAG